MYSSMKIRKIVYIAALISIAAAIISRPEKYVSACFDGVILWGECVLPSLFVFSVICSLLLATRADKALEKAFLPVAKKLSLPPAALSLFLMGACCGYPAGSRFLYEYRKSGAISEKDCVLLAPLCSSASPLFMLGTVGVKAFSDGETGIKLLATSLFSVILSSLIFCLLCKGGRKERNCTSPLKKPAELYDVFYGAVVAVCVAGGFIAFFHVVGEILSDFKILSPLSVPLSYLFGKEKSSALCEGLVEATGGIFALASSGGFFALPLAGFLTVFGGLSIIFQQLAYLQKCGVKSSFFIIVKFIQGILCFSVLCIISLI